MSNLDPLFWLPHINKRRTDNNLKPFAPDESVRCPTCSKTMLVKDAMAMEAQNDGNHFIALFCSTKCFMTAIPEGCCWRA